MPAAQASSETDLNTSTGDPQEGERKVVHGHPRASSAGGQKQKLHSLQLQR